MDAIGIIASASLDATEPAEPPANLTLGGDQLTLDGDFLVLGD